MLEFFFQGGRVLAGVFLPGADAPVQGQGHEQQQAIQAIRGAQLGSFQVKTTTFVTGRGQVLSFASRCCFTMRLTRE